MSPQTWSPPPFAKEVHEARIAKVREELKREGLDGILLFAQESLYYLFGYEQIGYWVFQAVYLPVKGDIYAICRGPDAVLIGQSPFIDEIQVWSDNGPTDPSEILAGQIGSTGASRIAVELSSHSLLAARWISFSQAAQGRFEISDGSELVAAMRAVKDSHEIECFRRAVGHLDQSYRRLEAELAVGVTELDLLAASLDGLYRDGASPTAIDPPIASGPRTLSQTHGPATNRVIAAGEPVTTEIGGASKRYHAVGARTYVLGEPTPRLDEMHTAASAALERGFEGLKTGEPLSLMADAAQSELIERGFTRAGRHFGYGTGIGYPPTWLEHLRIKVSDHTPATPGMTFFYFVGLADPEAEICVYVGEPILITESGCERPLPYEPEHWRR